ncbi:MAG: DNA-deoxyinosine glycosylase [Janthinobacterium lividum]
MAVVDDAQAASAAAQAALAGFAPVLDTRTRILMLGSFPGVASLGAAQYYAHPRNQFWRLIGTVLEEDLVSLAYPQRLERLLSRGVGLWDVLAACHREGSLDAAIRHAQPNDFASLRAQAPRLETLCFNGKTAGRFAPLLAEAGYRTLVLPSSSPANAMLSFEQKLAVWQTLLG